MSIQRLILFWALIVWSTDNNAFGNKTLVVPRSPSTNAALELAGWQREINLYRECGHYWSFSLTPEYNRSFRNQGLVNYLLDGHTSFVVSGSRVPNRGANDLLADYFGLPADFKSCISFRPVISSFVFDGDFYMGLDSVLRGLYFRVHAPIVHAKWDLGFEEIIQDTGVDFHPAGYMGATRVPRTDLGQSVHLALQGVKVRITGDDQDFDFDCTIRSPLVYGDVNEPIRYGLIFGRQVKTRLSDVQLVVGWNFFEDCWYHLGLNLRGSLPTGNKACAHLLFEPIVGNGKRGECGVGFTSHVDLWQCNDNKIAFYCDANITHLFASHDCRSFEFKNNGPGSRYMLLEQMDDTPQNLLVGGMVPTHQYAGVLYPAINKTTFHTRVSVPLECDVVAKVAFYRGGLGIDLGYNFWGRSAEKLICRDKLAPNLAIKGDAQLYGFTVTDVPVALNATQHAATLHGGQGAGNFVAGAQFNNDNADSPATATTAVPSPLFQLNTADSAALAIPQDLVNGSNPAQILTDDDINNCSALSPHALSHKIFMDIGYRWPETCVTPFLSVGWDVEFGPVCNNICNAAISQWAIWVKGGLSY